MGGIGGVGGVGGVGRAGRGGMKFEGKEGREPIGRDPKGPEPPELGDEPPEFGTGDEPPEFGTGEEPPEFAGDEPPESGTGEDPPEFGTGEEPPEFVGEDPPRFGIGDEPPDPPRFGMGEDPPDPIPGSCLATTSTESRLSRPEVSRGYRGTTKRENLPIAAACTAATRRVIAKNLNLNMATSMGRSNWVVDVLERNPLSLLCLFSYFLRAAEARCWTCAAPDPTSDTLLPLHNVSKIGT